jgi:hypothetical protein
MERREVLEKDLVEMRKEWDKLEKRSKRKNRTRICEKALDGITLRVFSF